MCSTGESLTNCPADCASCGDNVCSPGETLNNCGSDCGVCGDNICSSSENLYNCLSDCTVCGDGQCSSGESVSNCAQDCGSCGDGVCASNESVGNCIPDCASPPDSSVPLKGYVGNIHPHGSGIKIIGWACHPGWAGSIDAHLYLGAPAGIGVEAVMGTTANLENEQGVYDACGTNGGNHRYRFVLSADEVAAHHGKAVYVHGISPVGNGNFLLTQSGVHVIP